MAAARETWTRSAPAGRRRMASQAARTVSRTLVPVSESGTGKTLRESTSPRVISPVLHARLNQSRRTGAVRARTGTGLGAWLPFTVRSF